MIQLIGPMKFDYSKVKTNLETIFVDGGLNHKDLIPMIHAKISSIGDNDSNLSTTPPVLELPKDKDYSDFCAALKNNENEAEFYCLGFLGGRKDHEFSNFFEAKSGLRKNGYINFEDKVFITNTLTINLDTHATFSLFSFEDITLSIQGNIEYPLERQTLRAFSSHGLSNKSHGAFQIINLEQKPIIIFLN